MKYKNNREKLISEITQKVINKIICESDEKQIGDIIPDEGMDLDINLFHWKSIYRLMDNVKKAMEYTKREKRKISQSDVNDIIEYINTSIKNIMN